MLSGGTDLLYRNVLSAGHRRYVRIEIWSGTGVQLDSLLQPQDQGDPEAGLALLSGTVSATLDSSVARTLTLSVPMGMYPVDTFDLLAPFGNELRVFSGVTMGDGSTYVWQVFRGHIWDVEQDSAGTCNIMANDLGADVSGVGFVSPRNSNPDNTINAEWQNLILEAVPDATFGDSDVFDKLAEPLTWEFDRLSALDEMARSVGALWYSLASGDFVLRKLPWTIDSPPVLTMTDGPGGTVNGWRSRRSREGIFNVVTVTGERLNGDLPVHATASDTQVGSPTSTLGNFGVRSRLERLQTPSTQGGAHATAESLLRTYIAPTEEWTITAVPDASLELGDALLLDINGRLVTQVVTGFSLPLGLEGDMTISTRSAVVGGVH